MLAGYDWVSKHLIRGAVLGNGWQRDEGSKKIVVFGELIGGGLATMLSLTENHIGRIGIEAAAVVNPVVDWTFPDTVSSQELRQDEEEAEIDNNTIGKKRRSSKSKILGSWTAFGEQGPVNANCWLSLRKKCFSKPEYYFDPFASPLLFFRTPGLEVPSEDPPCAKSELSGSGSGEETSIIRRKAHRRFPPTGSGLRLPNMLISVGEDNLLRDQGVELAELMRRSLVMHERLLRRNEISDPWFYNRAQVNEGTRGLNEEAEQRVQLLKKPGTGLLGLKSPTERRKEMADIGNWLCDVLR